MPVRVLLVEDSRAMRDLVSAILEAGGEYVVDHIESGFEALRVLPRGDYGLMIADINLPDVSGIELCRFVRKSPRHGEMPVLVISTDSAREDVNRALQAGATGYLTKPFTAEALTEAVGRMVGGGGTR